MLMSAAKSTLVLVDFQGRLLPAISDGEAVVGRALTLATIAGLLDVPVIGTEQTPDKLGPNDNRIYRLCQQTLHKHTFDACDGGLLNALEDHRTHVIIGGCEAHICVLQTAMGLLDAGYRVWVVADAVGSRLPANKDLALRRLRQQGADIVSTEMVAFEWLGESEHPQFRNALAHIK
ncbi:isochorismatase family protein [Saccharospirillum alexandrii]|uniref:isochorismatase family protein n=1 Tax=Saccharospirillum alexandrii TaxID=2448477 RepID=UPI000FDAD301|nr:isochorismatase family protein [Saccharospirillum alexandrii]